jgi:hypothetical protein
MRRVMIPVAIMTDPAEFEFAEKINPVPIVESQRGQLSD